MAIDWLFLGTEAYAEIDTTLSRDLSRQEQCGELRHFDPSGTLRR